MREGVYAGRYGTPRVCGRLHQRRNRPGLPHGAAGRKFERDKAEEETGGSSASRARRFYRGHWHSALHARFEAAHLRFCSQCRPYSELSIRKEGRLKSLTTVAVLGPHCVDNLLVCSPFCSTGISCSKIACIIPAKRNTKRSAVVHHVPGSTMGIDSSAPAMSAGWL